MTAVLARPRPAAAQRAPALARSEPRAVRSQPTTSHTPFCVRVAQSNLARAGSVPRSIFKGDETVQQIGAQAFPPGQPVEMFWSFLNCGEGPWPMDAALARDKTFLVEIEVDGTRQLRERAIEGLYLFIAPPSIDELRRRLIKRGTNELEEINQRVQIAEEELAAARSEVAGAPLYDVIVENVVLADTIKKVEQLLWP